jgi:hypothetical protein
LAIAAAPTASFTLASPTCTVSIATPASTIACAFSIASPATAIAVFAATTPTAASFAVVVATFAALGQLRRHSFKIAATVNQLDSFGVWSSTSCLGRGHRCDEYAVDFEICLSSGLVADDGPFVQHRAVDDAFRLFGPGSAPGPGAVSTVTRQFDIDASAHDCCPCWDGDGRRSTVQ